MDIGNGERIFETMQKFQKIAMNTKMIGEISRLEFVILQLINTSSDANQGVTMTTLSEHLNVSKSAVSQMINTLEDKDYVERTSTKNDRRIVYVRLTEIGEHSLEKALQSFLQVTNQIFGRMGEEDTETLLGLLDKLYLIMCDYTYK
ncbi:MAG: MarR family transcriptional regulator [Desulfosporosinus sp.]|nr:MarR family transcriptional regulator [Desulfosporosinus sp.]